MRTIRLTSLAVGLAALALPCFADKPADCAGLPNASQLKSFVNMQLTHIDGKLLRVRRIGRFSL